MNLTETKRNLRDSKVQLTKKALHAGTILSLLITFIEYYYIYHFHLEYIHMQMAGYRLLQ